MPSDEEIKAATTIVPFARARHMIQVVRDEATEAQLNELLELMLWAYQFDREYDWTWSFKECPFLRELASYKEASNLVERWFGANQFPLNEKWQGELNVFENWILPPLIDWVDSKFEEYLETSTWNGIKGDHSVHWNPEKKGYVVVYLADDDKPTFGYQL